MNVSRLYVCRPKATLWILACIFYCLEYYLKKKFKQNNMQEIIEMEKYINWKLKFYTIWAGQAVSLITSAILQMAIIFYLTEKQDLRWFCLWLH